jgi:putative DNA primase/helicase
LTGIIGDILADYAQTAALETFIATHTPHHSIDIAGLRGSRLVIVPQTEGGKHWAEAKLKDANRRRQIRTSNEAGFL